MGVTLRDVARQASVSVGTASQALSGSPKVAAQTRSRVVDAARMLGYPVKDRKGVDAYNAKVSVVGLLSKHDLGEPLLVNPFYSHIQSGVEAECRKSGLSLMYANIEVDGSNHPVGWPPMVKEQRIDGLILVGTFIEETVDYIRRQVDVPIVLVDSYAPQLRLDSVVTDNVQGARLAVEHLAGLGHVDIGLVGSNPQSPPSILERREGYIQALSAHGIRHTHVEDSLLDRSSGYEATVRLLGHSPQVTAIFACNDDTAIGVYRAARELGLRVPADLSVVGFDNIDLAQELEPPLTTVHVHKGWMGIFGLRFLLDRIRQPAKPPVALVVTTQLLVRQSTAAPRR